MIIIILLNNLKMEHSTPKPPLSFITPQPGRFSKIEIIKIKIFFSFRKCKKWCTKTQNAIISLSFSFYTSWRPIENPLNYGEGAGQDVACVCLLASQAVATSKKRTQNTFAIGGSLIFNDSDVFATFLFKSSPQNKKWFITPPTPPTHPPTVTARWFINHTRCLRVKGFSTRKLIIHNDCVEKQ